ncbi:iron-containing alcohol dehydrogenase [Vibrio fluvialis]|nr:iron-containing alcohol dehydrogenase [Vibrio fluvialis]
MENFIFHNPTVVDFGKDRQHAIGEHLAKSNVKHVLVCFGSDRVKSNGLLGEVESSLAKHGITHCELGGIISNPVLSKVREGIEVAKTENVDAVLAVGGGSVLDSVKAIAAGAKYEGDIWELFIGKAPVKSALPIFSILTLAATGSEMNCGSVVTNEVTKEKLGLNTPALYPTVSIVNPELMKTVGRDYLVYSASDIIAHSIEGYFTAEVQPNFQNRLVESIIKTVIETTEKLLNNPDDYDARAQFAWASTQALNGLIYSGTGGFSYPNHTIEHAISAEYNVPHGAGLSVVMPAWMKWYRSNNEAQFTCFAQEVFGLPTALEGIEALEAWFDKVGTPTRLSQFDIKESEFDALADSIFKHANWFGNASTYTKEAALEILQLAK